MNQEVRPSWARFLGLTPAGVAVYAIRGGYGAFVTNGAHRATLRAGVGIEAVSFDNAEQLLAGARRVAKSRPRHPSRAFAESDARMIERGSVAAVPSLAGEHPIGWMNSPSFEPHDGGEPTEVVVTDQAVHLWNVAGEPTWARVARSRLLLTDLVYDTLPRSPRGQPVCTVYQVPAEGRSEVVRLAEAGETLAESATKHGDCVGMLRGHSAAVFVDLVLTAHHGDSR